MMKTTKTMSGTLRHIASNNSRMQNVKNGTDRQMTMKAITTTSPQRRAVAVDQGTQQQNTVSQAIDVALRLVSSWNVMIATLERNSVQYILSRIHYINHFPRRSHNLPVPLG